MRSRLLFVLVAIQAVISVGYGLAWMYYAQIQTASSTLGIVAEYDDRVRLATVTTVEGGSPAEAAGLIVGDRIRSASGMRLSSRSRFLEWDRTAIDEDTVLVVLRNGHDAPLLVKLATVVPFSFKGLIESSLLEILSFYPVVFLGVGLAVLLLRPMDSHAWLMALLFASFISVPVFPRATSGLPSWLAAFVLGYRAIGLTAIPAFFYAFFTRFPVRSPLDLRFPWLRWLNGGGVLLFGVTSVHLGGPQSPPWMVALIGETTADVLRLGYLFAGIPLGVAALFLNAWGAPTADARRKARVLLWGTAGGAMPLLLQSASDLLLGLETPAWVFSAALVLSSVLPVSFAYAVVKHRVLDVP
ncbi:MAG: PDZ domain-containing protein, partial [Vicinamibacterales bacterium]